MTGYAFVTRWRTEAGREAVWDAITRVEEWPRWWKGVLAVEPRREGGEDGVGWVHRFRWRSRLPYELSFDMETTRVTRLERLEGRAFGELEGTGIWTFAGDASGTDVRYEWTVRTTRAWMNLLAPVARPLFSWNHDVVMRWGAEGLGRRLGARVESL